MDFARDMVVLMMGAFLGAIATLFAQGIKDWLTKPKLNLKICSNMNTRETVYRIYLVVSNKGHKSTENLKVSFKTTFKKEPDFNTITHIKTPDIDPRGSINYTIGFMERSDSSIRIFRHGMFSRNDTATIQVSVSSSDVKTISKPYEITRSFLESLDEPPENGIEIDLGRPGTTL